MEEPADKTRMFRILLKGQTLSYFEHHLRKRLEAKDSEIPDNELIELDQATMDLNIGLTSSVQQFVDRLNDLNRYLLYFPEENPKQLYQDEIIELLDQAKA
jgi:hypothetical protein